MTDLDLERIILDLAVEDSYGLPELIARVEGVQPDLSKAEVRQLVRVCVRNMVESGLLLVTRLTVPGGDEPELDHASALEALSDDLEWIDSLHWRSHARVVATERGRKRYYGSE